MSTRDKAIYRIAKIADATFGSLLERAGYRDQDKVDKLTQFSTDILDNVPEITLVEERIRSRYEGMRNGIEIYAWWKDGTQYVGTTGRTLKQAIEEVDKMEQEALNTVTRREESDVS